MKRFAIIVMAFAAMLFVTTNFAEAQNKKSAKKRFRLPSQYPMLIASIVLIKLNQKCLTRKVLKI